MKTKTLFITLFSLVLSSISTSKAFANRIQKSEDSICIASTPNLFILTTKWVNEYSRLNPDTKIKNSILLEPNTAHFNASGVKLLFVSDEYTARNESTWKMVMGLDAIVPIINSQNPLLEEINKQGLSSKKMAETFKNPDRLYWNNLILKGTEKPINYYLTQNEFLKSNVAGFLKIDPKTIQAKIVKSDDEIISSVLKDPYSIAFCKVSSIIDPKSHNIIQGIKLLPIDKNGNGKLDYNEKIYDDINAFLRGVWIGKYPKELCNNIYLISSNKPSNENEVAFLAWVLTNGQQYLNPNGFGDLASNQRQANIDNLITKKELVVKSTSARYALPIIILVVIVFSIIFFLIDSTLQTLRFKKNMDSEIQLKQATLFNEGSIIVPDGLYFDKSHTWAFMEKDGIVGIGIDDFLQHITGPITRIKMKEPGEKIKKGEPFITLIQEGKQLNLKAPISGTIKSQNKNLVSNSSMINQSPYHEGWVYTIEPTNWLRDVQFLIFANGYKEWLRLEFLHLKDFLSVALSANKAQVVFQDGGEIRDGILKDLKPEIWEDFQTHFLDSSK